MISLENNLTQNSAKEKFVGEKNKIKITGYFEIMHGGITLDLTISDHHAISLTVAPPFLRCHLKPQLRPQPCPLKYPDSPPPPPPRPLSSSLNTLTLILMKNPSFTITWMSNNMKNTNSQPKKPPQRVVSNHGSTTALLLEMLPSPITVFA